MRERSKAVNRGNRGSAEKPVGRRNAFDASKEWYHIAVDELLLFAEVGTSKFELPEGWEAQSSLYADKQNNRQLYCYRKEVDGRVYEVMIDKRNDIKTFKVRGNELDKAQGVLGTDGRVVVKIHGGDSDDFIKVDDFIDREKLIIDAALSILHKAFDEGYISEARYRVAAKKINELAEKKYAYLRDKCDFHEHAQALKTKPDASVKKSFEDAYANANATFTQSIRAAAIIIGEARGNYNLKKEAVNVIAMEMSDEEKNIVAKRNRPLIVKVGAVGGQKMLSAQMPLGTQTLASTHRDGSHPHSKVSNHVRDVTGVFNRTTKTFEHSLTIDGHSSYCPIDMKDEHRRRFVAYQAVKERVTQLAEEAFLRNPKQKKVEINMATMMLLSPFLGQKIDEKLRGSESEYRQLEESKLALEMMRHEQPFVLKINGVDVEVVFTPTCMNKPVNMSQAQMLTTEALLQKRINARGFMEFKSHIVDRLGHIDIFRPLMGDELADKIEKYHADQRKIFLMEGVHELEEAVHPNSELNLSLRKDYAALHNAMEKYHSLLQDHNPHNKNVILYRNLCAELTKAVKEKEERLGDLYLELENEYRHQYNQVGDASFIERNAALQRDLLNVIKMTGIDPEYKKELITQLRYLRAEALHYSDTSKLPDDMAYQFHVNYLLANYSLEYIVEAFCKSAEDRTGFLRVALMAEIAFEKDRGYPPDFNNSVDKQRYQEFYAAKALEVSASLENTKENSDARGFNVNSKMTLPDFNMKAGKEFSLMAKGPYKEFKPKKMAKALSSVTEVVSSTARVMMKTLSSSGNHTKSQTLAQSGELVADKTNQEAFFENTQGRVSRQRANADTNIPKPLPKITPKLR